MNGATKILIGGVLTSLMAWGAHAAGGGERFIGSLQRQVQAAVGAETKVAFERAPLRRVALLSGSASPAERDRLLAIARKQPGVADARWIGTTSAAATAPVAAAVAPAPVEAPASAAVVADCQQDVNAVMTGQTILFRSGSAYVAPASFGLLDKIAASLKPCAGVSVEVQGHTDATGAPAINERLSQARADNVVAALVERGVPAPRLAAKGYGSAQPLQPGTDDAANSANRRTVFALSAATDSSGAVGVPATDTAEKGN